MKQIITMKGKYLSGILFLFFLSISANAQLLGWDANSNGGGFGASPWTPVTQNANITTTGLVRGTSILTSGTPAGGAWGGSGGWSAGSGVTTDNNSFHFTVVANAGYKVSLSGITTATRKSNSGPSGYTLYYSVNGGPFTSAGTATTTSTSGTTGTPSSISLSGIGALQDVPAGTVIKFRINPTGTGGNYYITGGTNSLRLNGTVQAAIPDAPVATDATNVLTNGFTSNWNAVAGASGYRIDIATDVAFTNILENYDNFAVAGISLNVNMDVVPNTTYYYRVRAEQGAAVSNNSNVIQVTSACNPVTQPSAQSQVFCGTVTVAQLAATGTGTIKWYTAQTGGTALANNTTVTTGIYYVSQAMIDGCESDRLAIDITVNAIPSAPTAPAQLFCGGGTVAGLQVTGQAPLWYDAETGGTALAADTVLATGTYYVSQTINGCEGPRAAVQVTVNTLPAAPAAAAQMFCGSGTVSELQVTIGDNPLWYTTETGGTALTADTALTTDTYYVSQTVGGCESARSAIQVTVNPVPAVPTAGTQMFCGQGTVSMLQVTTGEAPLWYNAETGGTALTADTVLATGTYYVSQTINGCESSKTAVQVTVNPIPAAPFAQAQLFCGDGIVAGLQVTGQTPLWYNAETGGTALTADTILSTGTYYVSQTIDGCESPRTAVSVTVNPVPVVPIAEAQMFCGQGTVGQLMVTSGLAPLWYNAETGGTALAADTALTTNTYYVSQTVDGCESARTAVQITVNPIPAAPVVPQTVQTFCNEATLADIDTDAEGVLWYTSPAGGTALAGNMALTQGTSIYYASQTVNGCESIGRTAVAVVLNITEAPLIEAQNFCGTATVASLEAGTQNVIWYTAAAGGTALANDTALATGTYYASQIINGCESGERTSVTVTVNTIPALPTAISQTFCGMGTVGELEVTSGENIQWYTAITGGTPLAGNIVLSTGIYYVSQTINGCESERAEVMVTVNTIPDAPAVQNGVITVCNNAVVADLDAEGEDILWYTTPSGGIALAEDAVLNPGISVYYASQTVNGCESIARTAVAVVFNITAAPVAQPQSFCNEATASQLEAEGESILWYADETGGTAFADDVALVTGNYYVSQTINGCESERLQVAITVTVVADPVGEAMQEFTAGETLADLDVTGENIIWYGDVALTQLLEETTFLADGTTYYAVAANGDCTSEESFSVAVNEVLGNEDFVLQGISFYPNPVKDRLTVTYTQPITSVTVFNLLGQTIIEQPANTDTVSVDMSGLASGTYILTIAAADKAQTIKVIKQ